MSKTKNQVRLQHQQAKALHGKPKYQSWYAKDAKFSAPIARPADALPIEK